jgi:hypothetical protein
VHAIGLLDASKDEVANVRGDCCVGNLERKEVRRRLLVQLVAVSRGNRSAKLFEDTALACDVVGVLVDGT